MKVCVPTMGMRGLDEAVAEHFGRAPTYTIVDTETGSVTVLPNVSEHMGGQGLPAEILAENGVDTLICSSLGWRARSILEQLGIAVYIGAKGTVRETLKLWERGNLQPVGDDTVCREHMFRNMGNRGDKCWHR
ncbi:MAG: dinitrogenase iron-molybdenum cofactor biosynthesis protein [Methanobacteriota archaeon]|nr:MAG: dinitrogenase iron-molybdenum cofactor biosynthesis protein [Euryarchaeota archaeon]